MGNHSRYLKMGKHNRHLKTADTSHLKTGKHNSHLKMSNHNRHLKTSFTGLGMTMRASASSRQDIRVSGCVPGQLSIRIETNRRDIRRGWGRGDCCTRHSVSGIQSAAKTGILSCLFIRIICCLAACGVDGQVYFNTYDGGWRMTGPIGN